MIYLVLSAIAGGVFVFCSFWVYHYVDLEHGSDEMIDTGNDAQPLRPEQVSRDRPSRALEREQRHVTKTETHHRITSEL